MSSFILYRKDGLIQGSGGASIDTTNLLTKVAASTLYIDESGDTFRGPLNMGGFALTGLPAAVNPNDAVRKSDVLTTTGTVFQGDVDMGGFKIKNYGTVSDDHDCTDKIYVEGRLTAYVNQNALPKNTDVYLGTSKIYYSITADPLKQLVDVTYGNANYVIAPAGNLSGNLFLNGAKIYSGSVVDLNAALIDKTFASVHYLEIQSTTPNIFQVYLKDNTTIYTGCY